MLVTLIQIISTSPQTVVILCVSRYESTSNTNGWDSFWWHVVLDEEKQEQ